MEYKGEQQHKESSYELCCNYREGHKTPQVLTKRGHKFLDDKRTRCLKT